MPPSDAAERGAWDQLRSRLRGFADTRFVAPFEFVELAISPRPLWRCDDEEARVRGLRDLETGTRFLVENEALDGFHPGPTFRRGPDRLQDPEGA